MRQLPSSEKFLGAGKGVGAGAGEPLEHELSMEQLGMTHGRNLRWSPTWSCVQPGSQSQR